MDLKALEQKLATYAGDLSVAAQKIVDGIKAIQASKLETLAEARWPGLRAMEDEAIKELQVFCNLDAELVGWLDVLFPKAA